MHPAYLGPSERLATPRAQSPCGRTAPQQLQEASSLHDPSLGEPGHQRWYAGCPGFTATNVPWHVAVTLPSAVIVASTVARSPWMSTAFAQSTRSGPIGVGRFRLTAKSEVTVQGGDERF